MTSVFVDTDVILDLFILREPHHGEALRLFTHFKRSKVKCFCSSIGLANAYYILAKIKNRKYAVEKMRKLRRLVAIAPVNEAIIDAALAVPYKDFEDSIQLQCALKNGIPTLITRNTKDYPKDQLFISSPHEYLTAAELER